MVQSTARSGNFAYLQYGLEATFNVDPGQASLNKTFGYEQKINSWTYSNNKQRINQLNSVFPKTFIYGQTRGSISVDFVLSNPWWLATIFDSVVDAGAGPFTHTYSISNKLVESLTAEIGIDHDTTDLIRTISGAVVNSATIRAALNEPVRCSLDLQYASELTGTSLDGTPATETVTDHIPYTFAHGSIDMPDGSTLAKVQDMEISFALNSELIYAQGSNAACDAFKKQFEITGRLSMVHADVVELNKVFAQTGANSQTQLSVQPTLTMTFTNGEAGTAERSIVISCTDIALGDFGLNIEPGELVLQDIDWECAGISIVATDNVSTSP